DKMKINSKGPLEILSFGNIDLNANGTSYLRLRGGSTVEINSGSGSWLFNRQPSQIEDDFKIFTDSTAGLEAVTTQYHNMYIKVHTGVKNPEGFYFLSKYAADGGVYSMYANVNCKNLWAQGDVSGVTWTQRSTREIKADIQEIQSDEVDALMLLKPSQYFLNKDVEEYGIEYLREHSSDFLQYGFIAEETPEQFQGKDKKSV
ncbi:tail fiber domain-containing protein, partial [Bacillus cereus group sp. N21]|uniref:tail fiber domain-containing protein n=1 Tax=Bacillus cereus group sp. N21 TaxID=2794591 RepID=UPI0018F787EA